MTKTFEELGFCPPFKITSVNERYHSGKCACCGRRIKFAFRIVDSKGNAFKVGGRCAYKAGDDSRRARFYLSGAVYGGYNPPPRVKSQGFQEVIPSNG